MTSLGFYIYTIMKSANSDSFISSCPIWIFFFVWLLWLVPKLRWIKVVRLGISVLFLIFRGNVFSFSPSSVMLAIALSYMVFIMLGYVPSISTFVESLYHEWMLNFIKSSLYSYDHIIYILYFVNVMYRIDWFADTESFWHPWEKPHLIMMYNPFNVLLNSVC